MLITPEEARKWYPADDSAHDFDHVLGVRALALRIAQAEGANAVQVAHRGRAIGACGAIAGG